MKSDEYQELKAFMFRVAVMALHEEKPIRIDEQHWSKGRHVVMDMIIKSARELRAKYGGEEET